MTPGSQLHVDLYSQPPIARASLMIIDTLPLPLSTTLPLALAPVPTYGAFSPAPAEMTIHLLNQCQDHDTLHNPSMPPLPSTLTTKAILAPPINLLHPWQNHTQQCWMMPSPTTTVPTPPPTHTAPTASHHHTIMKTSEK